MDFKLSTTSVGDKVIVAVQGDLDMKTAPDLHTQVDEAFGGGARRLVIDLTAIDFLDSSGLGALAAARNRSAAADVGLEIVCANPNVLKLFRITGMDRVLTIRPSLDPA